MRWLTLAVLCFATSAQAQVSLERESPRTPRAAGEAVQTPRAAGQQPDRRPAEPRIVSAEYVDPTDRYGHDILGAEGEYNTLMVMLSNGRRVTASWNDPVLFEDTAPRLADLDNDGAPEVITVETHVRLGARLAIWGMRNGYLSKLADGPFIGTGFRWISPAGAVDLDGDGLVEIAYVDRPHLAKVLRVWRYTPTRDGGELDQIATYPDLTNHRIGWDYIVGGIRNCGRGPEIVLSNANWSRMMSVRLRSGELRARDIGPEPTRRRLNAALTCRY